MGVEFHSCGRCKETYADCGAYFHCENCGARFCSDECGERKDVDNPDGSYSVSCVFCRNEDVSERELLAFCLTQLGMTADAATEKLLEQKRAEKRGD